MANPQDNAPPGFSSPNDPTFDQTIGPFTPIPVPPAAAGPTPLLLASLHAPARILGAPQPGKTTAP